MKVFSKKFLTLLEQKQFPCSLEIEIAEIRVTKPTHFTEKIVVLILKLITPHGETIKIIQDSYHGTNTHELREGDTVTVHDLGCKIESLSLGD